MKKQTGARGKDKNPARQTDESSGVIKGRQVTDATMPEKDLARGSEKETHARK